MQPESCVLGSLRPLRHHLEVLRFRDQPGPAADIEPVEQLVEGNLQLPSLRRVESGECLAARLRGSEAKLIEIALGVGYESEAAFSRAFRRIVGESPGAWRNRVKRP